MLKTTDYMYYSLFFFILTPLMIVVNKSLYSKIRNEEHQEKGKVIQQIIKMFSIIQCISWPTLISFECILAVLSENQIIESSLKHYLISGCQFCLYLAVDYVQTHSLVIAVARYTFTVFEQKPENMGIQKLRSVYIISSIVIPITNTVLSELIMGDEPLCLRLFYDISSSYSNDSVNNLHGDLEDNFPCSLLFSIGQKYFPSSVIDGIRVVGGILFIMLYSNVIEGFIYFHIYRNHKRYKYFVHTVI